MAKIDGNLLTAAIVVFVLDQITKWLAKIYLQPIGKVQLFPFVSLTFAHNTGAAFSLFQGFWLLFVLVAVSVVIAIFVYHKKFAETKRDMILLGMIAGGAAGNLIDRLLYNGAVIDFVDIGAWPIFNVADSALTIAALYLVLLSFKQKK